MASSNRWSYSVVAASIMLFSAQVRATSLAISYCSSQNNAGAYTPTWSEYQSTGLCGDQCQGAYAFAILQGGNCWCSNYIPQDQQNTYNCNQGCPGIDSEWCGNTDAGLFGYFLLSGGKPLATSGSGSGSGSGSNTPSSSSYSPSPSTSSSSSSSSSSASSSSSPPAITPSPTEVYTSVITVTGEVRTVLVTPTSTAEGSLGHATSSGNGGISAGTVAGIVVGVAIALLLLGGAGVLWWTRRRRRDSRVVSPDGSFSPDRTDRSSGAIPSRQVSQMSQAGLLGKKPRIMTAGLMGSANDPRSADTVGSNFDRRSLGTDQRLNPYALYSHEEAQLSSVSLQDNQDYSRQLRIANPDL